VLDLGEQSIEVPWSDRRAPALAGLQSSRITVGIRPDALSLVPADTPGALRGRVSHVEHLGNESIVVVDVGGVPTATAVSHLELPETPLLTGALAEEPVHAHGVDGLRGTLARLVPHQHVDPPPATARTRYGFYPVYERDEDTPAPLGGTVSIRIPVPTPPPRIGEALSVRVDLGQVFLFDHRGDRIRLPA
jgi:multiple sugar transport system ATP-binding protein